MKLIIINSIQFGYHIDTFYYCKYLKPNYNIIYICWDHGLPNIEIEGVRVIYVTRKGNILFRTIRFLRQALMQIKGKETVVFIKYFKWVSLALRLLRPKHRFVLDIRSGSVQKNPAVRKLQDVRLKFETFFFRNVTVISYNLAKKLKIDGKAHILPLGADSISSADKKFDELHLLYVGTLFNRNIEVPIKGFSKFYEEFKNQTDLSYTIIGSGEGDEENALRKLIAHYGLSEIINVTGRIPHTHLKPWFDTANVGVSYVPIVDYFDCQPVTKTFEYLLSGMPVIATRTLENKKVINSQNGVLVGDTVEDFYLGLKTIFEKRYLFVSENIKNGSIDYAWSNIVTKYFENILKESAIENSSDK